MITDELECPCCGDLAAKGVVSDGDPLLCGCSGWVSLDAETPPEVVIGDEACPVNAWCQRSLASEDKC